MIVWLNGTFGAGKTSTARELLPLVAGARYFDPEQVGSMLRTVSDLPGVGDFQHWTPWRGLVVDTAARLLDYVGGALVMPQTVLVEQYWREISAGLREAGIPVHHFVLHADQETLTRRIEAADDVWAREWRLEHLPAYADAFPWLSREGQVVDTTDGSPAEVARKIVKRLG